MARKEANNEVKIDKDEEKKKEKYLSDLITDYKTRISK